MYVSGGMTPFGVARRPGAVPARPGRPRTTVPVAPHKALPRRPVATATLPKGTPPQRAVPRKPPAPAPRPMVRQPQTVVVAPPPQQVVYTPPAEAYAEDMPAMVEYYVAEETPAPSEDLPPDATAPGADEAPPSETMTADEIAGLGADTGMSTGAKVGFGFLFATLLGAAGWATYRTFRP